MKHLICLLVLFLLTICRGYSQDSLQSRISQDSAIRTTLVQGNKYPNLVYSANGQILSNREIIARLQLYPEPADEVQKYHNSRTGLVLWLGVMLGSGIIASTARSQGNPGTQYAFAGTAVVALIAALISGGQADVHFGRAISIYNKRFVP